MIRPFDRLGASGAPHLPLGEGRGEGGSVGSGPRRNDGDCVAVPENATLRQAQGERSHRARHCLCLWFHGIGVTTLHPRQAF